MKTLQLKIMFLAISILLNATAAAAEENAMQLVAPGIWKFTLGKPEARTAITFRSNEPKQDALAGIPKVDTAPIGIAEIAFTSSERGCVVELPMTNDEQVYGLGLRLAFFNPTGKRISMFVNDSPDDRDGTGHAPVPFFVSTEGYGVFVDTLRYARFYCGNLAKADAAPEASPTPNTIATTTEELYKARELGSKRMTIEVPVAQGVDVYVIAGPTTLDAVCRFNLFSGGGCLPPLWGLGVYYRGYGKYNSYEVVELARYFRENHVPCDVFGLEPGWHSHAYSCTYTWSKERWPDPDGFLNEMKGMSYQLNLWEHAFVHPDCPFHDEIRPYSGDYKVWQGYVPDFTTKEACDIFGGYHEREFVKKGVTGFKLDECDDQPHKPDPWSFPAFSRFPSGLDGEQMHSLFGLQYQRVLHDVFRRNNIRTYGKVRASHALAAPEPFVLYSDAYEHRQFVRGILTSGFCGLLWQPELRTASSLEDMYRRIETAIFSPQTVIDAWFMPHPTWHQIDEARNKANELLPNKEEVQEKVKELLSLRTALVPYLYSAFTDYQQKGIPPFRALVTDYPQDKKTWNIDDEYMAGESLLVAPIFGTDTKRRVYLPEGDWYCFWTNAKYTGSQEIDVEMPPERIPLFVKAGSLLPLAKPVEYITSETVFEITVNAYGSPCRPFTLWEDDGTSCDYQTGKRNQVVLSWTAESGGKSDRSGNFPGERYQVNEWKAF